MKFVFLSNVAIHAVSHPARGAWIEMYIRESASASVQVAPRKGCVD